MYDHGSKMLHSPSQIFPWPWPYFIQTLLQGARFDGHLVCAPFSILQSNGALSVLLSNVLKKERIPLFCLSKRVPFPPTAFVLK